MSTSDLSIASAAGSPITITGLASGLNTSSIISELMSIEREPVEHVTEEQQKLQAQQTVLQGVQTSLQQLSSEVSEFALPSLFESSQNVTSSEPLRVSAATSSGAGVGGYEVEVTKLANSAQRTFTFTSPASEDTITIDGNEFTIKAGASAKELAKEINSDTSATVYAAALENGTVVLSDRATGSTGEEFIEVTDPGGALVEQAEKAKPGSDAIFTVDGVEGTASSNTVTTAIAGVTLTLDGLTTTGPVTIDVQAPGPNVSQIETQVQSFITLYNSTVASIEQQLTTKPPAKADTASEFAIGTLFADRELGGLLDSMREAMYEPIAGLSSEMASLADIGITTGAPTGGTTSQATLQGELTLDPKKLSEAITANPGGVEQMLQKWSTGLQATLNDVAEPGGSLDVRINGEGEQITQLGQQISNMDAQLLEREKALQRTYAQLEAVISQNTAAGDFVAKQDESLTSQ